jgi:hypothetical protein
MRKLLATLIAVIADYRHALSLDPSDQFSANALKELAAPP